MINLPQNFAPTGTRKRLPRIGKVDQHRTVEPKAPIAVQVEIDGEDRGRHQCDQRKIDRQNDPPHPLRKGNPKRCQHDDDRKSGDVTRHRAVERESVPKNSEPLSERGLCCPSVVEKQESRLLQQHPTYCRTENGSQKQQASHVRSSRHKPNRPHRRYPARYKLAKSIPRPPQHTRSWSYAWAYSSPHIRPPVRWR